MPVPAHDELYTQLSYVALGGGGGGKAEAAKPAKKAEADDDLDLFGDSDEEALRQVTPRQLAQLPLLQLRMPQKKKKKKEKPPAKSLVTLVVKPWEADTNLDELFKLITATEKEGLVWGTACEGARCVRYHISSISWPLIRIIDFHHSNPPFTLTARSNFPFRYGIFQLKIVCTIVDDLVSSEDITDLIEQFEDYVQSCQMLSMNKL